MVRCEDSGTNKDLVLYRIEVAKDDLATAKILYNYLTNKQLKSQ